MADGSKHTLSLTIAYCGAPFSGFARQRDPGDILTVQGEIESSLALLFKRPIETVCAGRTDAGVHARAQTVSFSLSGEELHSRSLSKLKRSLNALTHNAIMVHGIEERALGFSARFDARSREYRYFLFTHDTPSLFLRDYSWHIVTPLDIDEMCSAAKDLVGEHDFKSFCKASSAKGKSTRRTVFDISIAPESILDEEMIVVKVVGNAFLHTMVRTMVGTLVMVGKGLREPGWIREVLADKDRRSAGECAPAQGLVLWNVEY